MADVGQVHDLGDVVAEVLEGTAEHVGEDVSPEVADVRVLVDGRAARVDPDASRIDRPQVLLPPGQRVVDSHPTMDLKEKQ